MKSDKEMAAAKAALLQQARRLVASPRTSRLETARPSRCDSTHATVSTIAMCTAPGLAVSRVVSEIGLLTVTVTTTQEPPALR